MLEAGILAFTCLSISVSCVAIQGDTTRLYNGFCCGRAGLYGSIGIDRGFSAS